MKKRETHLDSYLGFPRQRPAFDRQPISALYLQHMVMILGHIKNQTLFPSKKKYNASVVSGVLFHVILS